MACTTLLVGRLASADGSTIVGRNEDSSAGSFTSKRFCVVTPEEQPRTYVSVLSKFTVKLPDDPMRYTAVPNANECEGIWASAGINDCNVGMSATETITINERVLSADPLVEYVPAKGKPGEADYQPEVAGGIGEEDMVTLVLPYIHSAREGVLRMGKLLEQLGTYEMNGIAFHDANEIWWLETIGGHHWIARRVPDDCYVVVPNQLGIDRFDITDALGEGKNYLCSADLASFMGQNHLDLTIRSKDGVGYGGERPGVFNPRHAFGTSSDADHVYNTPRAWAMERYLNPHACTWDGPGADLTPTSDDIPWSRIPERKLTIEDVKYVLSLHYQQTPYDPYGTENRDAHCVFRPIGINRTSHLSVTQINSDIEDGFAGIHWIAFASNAHNALVPMFAHVDEAPAYLSDIDDHVTCDNLYWASRLIAAMADASWSACLPHIERYQAAVAAKTRTVLKRTIKARSSRQEANEEIAAIVRDLTDELLSKVLFERSLQMRNSFSRSDN